MSKVKKRNDLVQNKKGTQNFNEKFAFKSVITSGVLGGLILIISILFNGEIITIFINDNLVLQVFNIIFKVILILLFFIFMMISIGNYKELTGKPLDFKIMSIIFIISLIQGFRNPLVLFFSFVGLIFLLVYMYLVQIN
jgi:Na+-driven multidrug efflux pump